MEEFNRRLKPHVQGRLSLLNRSGLNRSSEVRELSKENKDLIKQLKTLNENIDHLTKVTAISVGKETLFKGKKETGDKIDALDEFKLPDKIIAMLVGSTPDSVKSLRSKRTRTRKSEPKRAAEKHDEQKPV